MHAVTWTCHKGKRQGKALEAQSLRLWVIFEELPAL